MADNQSANPYDTAGFALAPNQVDQTEKTDNPYDAMGDFGLKPGSSASGSFARGAERGALPAAGGLAGAEAGAEIGAGIGAFGGPLDWATVPVGGLVGGLVGGFGGSYATQGVQDYGVSKAPDSWKEAIGQDDRQQQLDQQQHPYATFAGGLAPFALTLKPGLMAKGALPDNPTTLQTLLAHPASKHIVAGLGMGGMEIGQEVANGETPDWGKIAISTGFGVVFNKPTRIGQTISNLGARVAAPITDVIGRPTVDRFGNKIPEPFSPDPTKPIPTIAEMADQQIMGPGITDAVFDGSQQQNPEAKEAAQNAAMLEKSILVGPTPPDIHDVVRRMEPEVFEKYDALVARRNEAAAWVDNLNNPTDENIRSALPLGPDGELFGRDTAQKQLSAVENELHDLAPQVSAAYRRAAESVGAPMIQPEATKPVGEAPASTEAALSPQAQIHPDHAAIADDVTKQLIAAGRAPEEAQAAGQLVADHTVTRAERFGGALGTPLELHNREGAKILGFGKTQPAPISPVAPKIEGRTLPAPVEPTPEVKQERQQVSDQMQTLASGHIESGFSSVKKFDDVASAALPETKGQPAGVFMFDPTKLGVDAERFQFKSGGDQYGVTNALKSVSKWDKTKAGVAIVWQQNDGKLFVSNGHQRTGLARRLIDQGKEKNIELPGLLLREKDGFSAADARAISAVTNIAEGTGSALDGAKILRSRPDLLDGSLPLSEGKGKQAAALAKLDDEAFRMVVNEVVPEHQAAIVGDLIPNDGPRQIAAMKAISRFEPKNADETVALVQRVAQAELAKAEAGKQTSMFGDLETAESTAGQEMQIVGRTIKELNKDKSLFARVVANADRIEGAGSQIDRSSAESVATDSEIFAKVLSTSAYSAGPIRNELISAARDLRDGKATVGEASARIVAAVRRQVEENGGNGLGLGKGPENETQENTEGSGLGKELTPQEAWNGFVATKAERAAGGNNYSGAFNGKFNRAGDPVRGRATQEWTPGNLIDVGFVKDLLVVKANKDGSFDLISKPDKDGISKSYSAKPHEGLGSTGSVNFTATTKNLPARERELAQRSLAVRRQSDPDFDRIVTLVDNHAPIPEIEADPYLQGAVRHMAAIPLTSAQPGFMSEVWKADRTYDFPGGKVQGYDNAVTKLTDMARDFSTNGPVLREKKATVLLGPPASGKSTYAEKYATARHAALIDSDEAKRVIPEFNRGIGASAVHEESAIMAHEVQAKLMSEGSNIVIPKVGHNADGIHSLIETLKANGYSVDLVGIKTSYDNAFRRMIGRFASTGRLIDPAYVRAVGEKPTDTYRTLKEQGVADRYAEIDNNGKRGEAPQILDDTGATEGIHGLRSSGEQGVQGQVAGTGQEVQSQGIVRNLYQRDLLDEKGAEGLPQTLLPGVEPSSLKQRLELESNKPMRGGNKPAGGMFDEEAQKQQELFQSALGKIRIAPGNRPIITLFRDANASTFLHETGHQWLEELTRDAAHPQAPDNLKADSAIVRNWLGSADGAPITVRQHEKFARGFEQYMREGVAPSARLVSVFSKFKNWLTSIYQSLKGLGAPINDDIRGVFDRQLSLDPQRTVIAEPHEAGPSLADVHMGDATDAHPIEADGLMARVASEKQRAFTDLPPEVQNEIESSIQKYTEANAARTEPATENGPSEGRPAEVDGGSGRPEPVTTSSASSAVNGAVEPSGSAAGPEGAGVSGQQQRSSSDTGHPLAPQSAEQFDTNSSKFVDKAGNIRLDNIQTPEDIKQAMREMAEQNGDFIAGRRGVVTDGQVLDLAAAVGIDQLSAKKIGEAFSAEEIKAAEKFLAQSVGAATEAAKKAVESGSDEDIIAYAQAKSRHAMAQGIFSQATAEAGRALRALRRTQELWNPETTSANGYLKEATGTTLFQLKQEAELLSKMDTPEKASKYIYDSQKRGFGRGLLEYFVNNLISGPATHTTYAIANEILSLWKIGPETLTAAAIGKVREAMGNEGPRVYAGEAAAGLSEHARAMPKALTAAVDSLRTNTTVKMPGEVDGGQSRFAFGGDLSKIDSTNKDAKWDELKDASAGLMRGMKDAVVATGELLKSGGDKDAPLVGWNSTEGGAIPNFAIKGVTVLPTGDIARGPGRVIGALHSYQRVMNYSIENNQKAYRQARSEGLTGPDFDARVAALRQNPSEESMAATREVAGNLTLMGQGGDFVRKLSSLINANVTLPLLGTFPPLKFIDPFVKIAANIMDQSIIQRSPVGLLSPEIRADIGGKNGKIAQDQAMARMLAGTALGLTFAGLAANGLASGSGPTDVNQRAMLEQTGWRAHSVRLGDMWIPTNRLGPLGMLSSLASDFYDISHVASDGDLLHAGSMLMHAFTQNILDESFMRGPADLIKALEDSNRYGESYLKGFASSFVPFSVGMAQMDRAMDPYQRATRTVLDAIKAKIPPGTPLLSQFIGSSDQLFARRNIWGEPMPNQEAFIGKGITSIYETKVNNDPVNIALTNLSIGPAPVKRMIRNVQLTDQQYDDYSRIAGRLAKQRLDVLVNSPDFNSMPNFIKVKLITEFISQSRVAAEGVILAQNNGKLAYDAGQIKYNKMMGITPPK